MEREAALVGSEPSDPEPALRGRRAGFRANRRAQSLLRAEPRATARSPFPAPRSAAAASRESETWQEHKLIAFVKDDSPRPGEAEVFFVSRSPVKVFERERSLIACA